MARSVTKLDRGSPSVVIINESRDIDAARLKRAVAALQKQIDRDFFTLWGWRAKLLLAQDAPPSAMVVRIKASSAEGDNVGYHFLDGVPRTEVFVRDSKGQPFGFNDICCTLSHELLEMIADPGANLYADGYYLQGARRVPALVSFEVCDPVQDKTYEIDGILVSDFVAPEWFEGLRQAGSMRFSHLDSVKQPFAMTEGGYMDVLVEGQLKTRWGTSVNPAKKKTRRRLKARLVRPA